MKNKVYKSFLRKVFIVPKTIINMLNKIKKEIKTLPDNFVVLTIVPYEKSEKINLGLLNFLINEQKNKGSYIAINKPYQNISEILNKNKIDSNQLFFIDCMTKKAGGQTTDVTNCSFIDNPSNLTSLGIEIEKLFKKAEHNFIFLDSLNMLAQYNNKKQIIQFTHSLLSKVRVNNIKGIVVGLHEETDDDLIAELSQLCDKVLDFRDD